MIGDENSTDRFRGMDGQKHKNSFADPRKGTEVITTNLWSQGNVPEKLHHLFPVQACFMHNNFIS